LYYRGALRIDDGGGDNPGTRRSLRSGGFFTDAPAGLAGIRLTLRQVLRLFR